MYDDGFVLYLNGLTVLRVGLPQSVGHDTAAFWHEAGTTYQTFELSAYAPYLDVGRNTISVEVHQESPSSSDLVFDLGLRYETVAPGTPTPRGSAWLYHDRGELASGWQTSSDTTGWDGGRAPLGYNNADVTGAEIGSDNAHDAQRRPVTTYFRRRFTVASPSAVIELRGELLVDGGAVIYLNGTELARPHMPSGSIGFDTRASSHESNGIYEIFDWSAQRSLLRAGENVLAVEVHQDAAHTGFSSSDDLSFDLAFEVITAETPRIPGCTPMTCRRPIR